MLKTGFVKKSPYFLSPFVYLFLTPQCPKIQSSFTFKTKINDEIENRSILAVLNDDGRYKKQNNTFIIKSIHSYSVQNLK